MKLLDSIGFTGLTLGLVILAVGVMLAVLGHIPVNATISDFL